MNKKEQHRNNQLIKYNLLQSTKQYPEPSLFDNFPTDPTYFWSIPELSAHYTTFEQIALEQISEINSVIKKPNHTHIINGKISPYGCFCVFEQMSKSFLEQSYFITPNNTDFDVVLQNAFKLSRLDLREKIKHTNKIINGLTKTYKISHDLLWSAIQKTLYATPELEYIKQQFNVNTKKSILDYMGFASLFYLNKELENLIATVDTLQNTNKRFDLLTLANAAGARTRDKIFEFGTNPGCDIQKNSIGETNAEINKLKREFKKKFGQQYIK